PYPSDLNFPRFPRIHGIGDVVLKDLPRGPARDIEEFVVQGQPDVRNDRWHGIEAFQKWGQLFGIHGNGGHGDGLSGLPFAVLPIPGPHRAGQVGGVDDHADETVILFRVVRGAYFQRHLVFLAEIDFLYLPARFQVEEVQPVAVLAPQERFRHESILDVFGHAPFRSHQYAGIDVPPEIVGHGLAAMVQLPLARDIEAVVIHGENTGRALAAIRRIVTDGADEQPVGATMHGMGPAVAGFSKHLIRFDGADQLRLARILAGIQDVDSR